MDPQHTLPPAEHLLPAPRHTNFFWFWLAVLDIAGVTTIAFGLVLGQYVQTLAIGLGVALVTITALVNHRHNHDHRWLLIAAALVTVGIAFLRGLIIFTAG